MPECSICRRQFDDRFKVFVPPHPEPFDSIECAQKAAAIWGVDAAALTPVVLPAVDVTPAPPVSRPAAAAQKKGLAALAALALVPGQAALAGGVGLAAAGTAASIYLSVKPPGHSTRSETAGPAVPQIAAPAAPRPAPRPGAPPTKPAPVAAASPAKRPPDAAARRLVVTHHTRSVASPSPASGVVATHPSPSSSASASSGTQFVSRTTPATSPASTSAPAPASKPQVTPKPQATPKPSATPKPKPKPKPKPTPAPAPTPTPLPQTPTTATTPTANPTDPTPTGTATRTLAAVDQAVNETNTPPTTGPNGPGPEPQPQPEPNPRPPTPPISNPQHYEGAQCGGGGSEQASNPGHTWSDSDHSHHWQAGGDGDHGEHGNSGGHGD